jgi:probable HAF family extracellular repeat protein
MSKTYLKSDHFNGGGSRDYTYTTIDDPLATNNNVAEAINSANKIVGYYSDGSLFHGFLYSGGTHTTLDFSSNVQTFAEGINAQGQIVGWYNDFSHNHGFLYSDGVYTTIDDPLGTDTYALGINASGDIVGYYQTYTFSGGSVDHGFIYSDGVYTTLEHPLQGTDPSVQSPIGTTAFGINASGQIVGYFYDATGLAHGYLYDNGTYTTLDDPLGTDGTFALDINDAGQIVGQYFDNMHGQHGFLYSGGNYTTIDAFGITNNNSTATGINNAGNIVGGYSQLTSPYYEHSFVATATPGAARKFVPTETSVMSPVTNSSINSNDPQQDTFVFAPNFGQNTITNFNVHNDTLELPKSEFTDLAAVLADAHQNGTDTIIAHDAHDIITLHNVSLSQLHDSHILLA